jgi:hypothetical protein
MRCGATTSLIHFERLTLLGRYLTKICDQVIALLSATHSTSLVWGDDDSDTESIDIDDGDEDRLFTYEVAKRNEQEESATLRPGFKVVLSSVRSTLITDVFKMNSPHISRHVLPAECPADPSIFLPSLLHGETAQGFWNASYVHQTTRSIGFGQHPVTKVYLRQLL